MYKTGSKDISKATFKKKKTHFSRSLQETDKELRKRFWETNEWWNNSLQYSFNERDRTCAIFKATNGYIYLLIYLFASLINYCMYINKENIGYTGWQQTTSSNLSMKLITNIFHYYNIAHLQCATFLTQKDHELCLIYMYSKVYGTSQM